MVTSGLYTCISVRTRTESQRSEGGEMIHVLLQEDPSSVHSTPHLGTTTTCNFSSRGPNLSGLNRNSHPHGPHTQRCTSIYT